MSDQQPQPTPPVKPKRKKFLPVIAAIILLCIVWYWYWNRIVSDVKIFSPPEWVWLEGETELMIIPGKDELLIHRSKQGKPHNEDDKEYFEQLNEIRRHSEIQFGTTIKSDYYYLYNPKSNQISIVDENTWNNSNGYITDCESNYSTAWLRTRNKVYHSIFYYELLKPNPPMGERLVKTFASPFLLECSKISYHQLENTSEIYQQCIENYLILGITPSSDSLAVIVSSKKNINTDINILPMPFPMGGARRQKGSSRQHYHQLLSMEDFTWIRSPVRIPMVTNMNGATPKPGKDLLTGAGWSYDERFVVYTGMTSFCIVEIDKQGK